METEDIKKIQYEDDFVDTNLIEFEVEGKKFKYKPTTAEDELSWSNEYIDIVDGKPQQNFEKITKCKLRNLMEVAYGKDIINKIIGVDKEWKGLSHEQKSKFLGKLKPSTFDKIIKCINNIDSPSKDEKKN